MRKTIAIAAVGFSLLLTAGLEARADDPQALGHKQIFELYCGGCHGLNGSAGRAGVPDLSNLTTKYGAPFPTAHLVDFVLNDRRVGGSRICGERVLMLPSAPFNDSAERVTVRAALDYIAAAQAPH